MEILKVGLVMAAGLGSTWAARVTTDALLGAPAALVQATAPASPASEPTRPSPQESPQESPASAPASSPAIPEMSREEMDAELKRAQAEISGSPARDAELREFRPTRPLPADLPIALPSDI